MKQPPVTAAENTNPIKEVKWTLVSAMPYPITGERVNIGVVVPGHSGALELLKGNYRERLMALCRKESILRTIEAEVARLERTLDEAGQIEETQFITLSQHSSVVHVDNQDWRERLVRQMVPPLSGGAS